MTINSVNSVNRYSDAYVAGQNKATQPPAPKKEAATDTVQLSQAAVSAKGDVDHDGDSH